MRDEELTTITSGTTVQPMKIDLSPIFNIPGVVWIGLIAALTKWVSDSFPDQPWAPAVVIGLGAVAKLIQLYWPKPATETPAPAATPGPVDGDDYTWSAAQPPKETNRRKIARLLVG